MPPKIKLDTKTYEFDKLEQKYGNFFAPAFLIDVGGQDVVKQGAAVTTVSVTQSVEKANNFSFTINNAYNWVSREFDWQNIFTLGNTVEIKMGYVDKLETLFYGIITNVSYNYPADGTPTMTVTGMDYSYVMMKGKGEKTANSWEQKMNSDVVKEIVQKYALSTSNIESTNKVKLKIDRQGQDDYTLIKKLAQETYFEFFVLGKDVYFRKPFQKTTPIMTLVFGKNLRSFQTSMKLDHQIKKFIVTGYDPKEKKKLQAESKPIKPVNSNTSTGQDLLGKFAAQNKIQYTHTNLSDQSELQTIADAQALEASMRLISGSGESIGLPELIAGRFLKLTGVGARFSQPMYLRSVTHRMNKSGYLTTFEVAGNAV
ncbi:phage late control D family protein [Tumebacillus lipolyticus]|uniref:Phage late control D family protein n=1 Tax=Tumebacillus lipolyticus TaxID=1280370 RepID=A0ABW4ZYW8_9BACL